jgi:hypothetical protein
MQQRNGIGGLTLDRPIHRACVVPGCPCGSLSSEPSVRRTSARDRSRAVRANLDRGAASLAIDPAWHSVGLPIA